MTPGLFWNIFFHAGATAYFGVYCPGLLTALTLYPPVVFLLFRAAVREGLVTRRAGWIALLLGGLFHFGEVAYDVFHLRSI